jgi:GNAT superfamily N-acetyltransferase
MPPLNGRIERAGVEDAEEILALQQLAYRSEARLYGDWSIPPLTQSLDELRSEFSEKVFLKATLADLLIGSVRGRFDGHTCTVGRLIVHPEHQRRGIGTRLMQALEAWFPDAERFELFTGERSEGNIRFYTALGYAVLRKEPLSGKVTLVFMEKRTLGVSP